MKKCIVFLPVFIVFLLLAGCQKEVEAPLPPITTETDGVDQVTYEKQEEQYKYLSRQTIDTKEAEVTVYLPNTDEPQTVKDGLQSSAHGVTVKNTVQKEKEINKIIAKEIAEIKSDLKGDKNIKEIETGTKSKGTTEEEMEYALQGVSWQVVDKEHESIYPCMCIVKSEQITDTHSLTTVITIDNQSSDDDSAAMIQEIADIYGINFEE